MTDENKIEPQETPISTKEQLEEDFGDIDSQLFIGLASRWRDQDGKIAFGLSERKLREKTGLSAVQLDELLTEFGNKIRRIGLELVSYLKGDSVWYCLRSIYVVPNELTMDEQAILGTIVFLIEEQSDHRRRDEKPITSTRLIDRLVKRGYYSKYALTKALRKLEKAGYIKRSGSKIRYGIRTKIELPPERRREIAEKTEGVLL